ncbi:MAG: COG4280 domain-containing protein [Acidimicrobiales bacterium]
MTSTVILALAVFGASAVEMVEAFTIVLAAGVTRGWRSAIEGLITAVVVLTALVAGVGVPLVHYVPLDLLRVVVGGLLLVLGLNWLRKAVLRASGHKALHDEDEIYERTVRELSLVPGHQAAQAHQATLTGSLTDGGGGGEAARSDAGTRGPEQTERAPGVLGRLGNRDATGFTVAFKGVLLEGLEVVMIVLTLGTSAGHLGLAAAAAGAAAVVVGIAGLVVARQLSEVPENAMKMTVGIMLTSFGLFWVGEGSGVHWPGSDLFLLALVAIFLAFAASMTRLLRRALPDALVVAVPGAENRASSGDADTAMSRR